MTDNITTIKVEPSVRDALQELGTMKDSFNSVIKRLIEEHKELEKIKNTSKK
ncbi:MAG TPA: hypothetical protein VKA95_05475 [Nitrososphaeraceae archaeon]|nr:hypothetical protein [Nitrososphaeraceae archaeon]